MSDKNETKVIQVVRLGTSIKYYVTENGKTEFIDSTVIRLIGSTRFLTSEEHVIYGYQIYSYYDNGILCKNKNFNLK